jgi:hypothetical protein
MMNKDSFLQHIENTRDCDPAALNAAVSRGLRRSKSDRVDSGKLVRLIAACVFTLAMCFTVNLRPFQAASEAYYRSRIEIMPGAAETLEGYKYIADTFTDTFIRYLGGI